ncbi:alpha/beta fold hydrolase [Pseudomonas sp. LFM046]|uniref:alpha/beta fold hydrolase n=1 Tax=Pseudomonas sp. LFM046 TaxID=1608357 RepID=UPI0005CFC814|nr:alpha/beta fold hydrolase [Pseudomonas sp. LFM046]
MAEAFSFAGGRFHCPYRVYQSAAPGPVLILLPALGVAARKYEAFALSLVAAGNQVLVVDWPGQGESGPKPNRRLDYGYRDLVDEFVPSLLAAARQHFPGKRQVLLGHSLGGHIATLFAAANPDADVAVVGVACGNIHYRHWEGRRRLLTPSVAVLFNLLTAVLGYLPGKAIGFGGHEARRLMRDWGQVAWSGNFDHLGLDLAAADRSSIPSLFIGIVGDPFAPEASTRGLAALIQERPAVRMLQSPRPASENAHSAWLRSPAVVVEAVVGWLALLPCASSTGQAV